MNRIDARLSALRAAGRKALVPFITAGDPSREVTVPVMHALVEGGADLIELGVPFSDPMADGPVIQKSSERAIERKAGLGFVFEAVRAFRSRDTETPVVLMGYLNPVEMRGLERFADEAAAAGVDGVLLVDLPPEEADPVRTALTARGLHLIALVAPTTTEARLAPLQRHAQGYLYYVSFAGVTGAAKLDTVDVAARAAVVRAHSPVPVLIGFGIKDAASAKALAAHGDGVIVGSALVQALAEAADPAAAARAFLAAIRVGLDG
ncbi:tryptophan synthase subunit alpha [Silanimonas sp.]|uniref:tryptophan synthase subunit alpha n=1 Tax=Silanimonas sp. TaxID=1929290 RepID=UPI001BC3A775|nr:tryptophan synthase subunit alpha [Silanimonas sp.]MBS3895733.1 tryptophan synthase subunit alpha [Silanimonas sp.]MBS3924757.1 tryptophan synthase subunit alpha [Xanthomonadaceae bacterium]